MTRRLSLGPAPGSDFDAAEEVALHPVRAGQIDVLGAVGVEVEDAVVLEEAADDRAHADVLRQALDARAQAQTPRTIRSMVTPACEAS
jgi:hypothetical protein